MDVPSFGASIHFEMYRDESERRFIRILYHTDNSKYSSPLDIPGLGTFFPLDDFIDWCSPITPTSSETYDSLCQNWNICKVVNYNAFVDSRECFQVFSINDIFKSFSKSMNKKLFRAAFYKCNELIQSTFLPSFRTNNSYRMVV